jgi:hypothetical protein
MYSVNVLNSTIGNINYIGQSQLTAGVSTLPESNNTITISLSNFIGRIYIEGSSVQTQPTNTEWYPITIGGNLNYIQYPYNTTSIVGATGTFSYNFIGNFLWIRARIDRTYLNPQPTDPYILGFVHQIWINYGLVTNTNCDIISNNYCNLPKFENQYYNYNHNYNYNDNCYYNENTKQNINGPWYNPIGPNCKPGYTYGPWQGSGPYYGPNCNPNCPADYNYGQCREFNQCNGNITYYVPNYINSYGNYNGNVGYYDPAWPPNNI